MEKKSPIDDLYTNAGPFDVDAAARALKPLIAIQNDTHEIHLKNEYKVSVETKILAFALAKKLLAMERRIDSEFVSAAEISDSTGLKKGTVDPAFKNLREGKNGFLMGKGQRYEIPRYRVPAVIDRINEAVDKKQ